VAAESENLHRPALDDLQARATALGTT